METVGLCGPINISQTLVHLMLALNVAAVLLDEHWWQMPLTVILTCSMEIRSSLMIC